MQSLQTANPLGRPVLAASAAGGRVELPRGLWIVLGVGGGALVLVLALLLGLRAVGQRLIAENQAKAAQRATAGQAAAPAAGPQLYQSPTGRFSVEFPRSPKRELVRSAEPGGLSHWEAELTLGEFSQGQGEQYLVTEQPKSAGPTPNP